MTENGSEVLGSLSVYGRIKNQDQINTFLYFHRFHLVAALINLHHSEYKLIQNKPDGHQSHHTDGE